MKNIMIKTAIASAVVAATTATTVADVKVYGRLRTLVQVTDVDGGDSTLDVANRSSRFGLKASSEISDGLTAFGRYEFNVPGNDASGVAGGRLAYVGLKGGFGEISLGNRWSPYYTSTMSYVDGTNAFGGTWNNCAGHAECSDFRNSHTLNYKNKFGVASVGLQLKMQDQGALDDNNVDEIALGVDFKAGAATIGVGYLDTTDVSDAIALHARSKFGAVTLGGTLSKKNFDAGGSNKGAIVQASYGFGGGKSAILSFGKSDNADGTEPTSLAAEYTHNLGAGMKVFGGVELEDNDNASPDTTRYGAGFRYDF